MYPRCGYNLYKSTANLNIYDNCDDLNFLIINFPYVNSYGEVWVNFNYLIIW